MCGFDECLDNLRASLLKLKATGSSGFEGLVATALADVTGLVIRLARSGSQFGRDASSGPGSFAVALEAKRYGSDLRLEDLAGKAVLGATTTGGIDVWALCATTEVGDDTVRQLHRILEDHGVSLVVLDWAPRPLPPLAVLLASARSATLSWFAVHQPDADHARLAADLEVVSSAEGLAEQEHRLRDELTSWRVGLDALRRRNIEWLRDRFRERAASQNAFGQFITVADPASPALPRGAVAKALAEAIVADRDDLTVVVVLGDEGVGKTWLVAQWWAALPEPPILILVAGRRADLLEPREPLESLARLLAQQEECSDEAAVAGWRRRLERWRGQGAEGHLRFVVVLDGLNEHVGRPWADTLRSLAPEVRALGGLVVATAREAFWRRDVLPRIRGSLAVHEVRVVGYSDEELAAVLARVGAAPADLPPRVREFVRNPRVCAVASTMLGRLSLQPGELTVERLLLEYWQRRLEERGDLVGHNVRDFEKLLRSHARAWREQPGRRFDRDEWIDYSGAVRRGDGRDIRNDLTEIEEGRFMQIAPDESGAYEFRRETVPFALALLVTDELRSGLRSPGADANELLDAVLAPVSGFDIVAEVVTAAVGLACLTDGYPRGALLALLRAWLGLQNVADETFATVSAYVPTRPEIFLDAVELPDADGGRVARVWSLVDILGLTRDHPRVRAALQVRLPRWLGRWSRRAEFVGEKDEQANRQAASREARIDGALAALLPGERELFDRVCLEAPEPAAVVLGWAASRLMAGRAQAHLAPSLVGWAFARAVAPHHHDTGEELAWVVRLNPIDHAATEMAVRDLLASITDRASEPARRAAAIALHLLGTRSTAALADELVAPVTPRSWRRVENFCDTDPFDPNAPPGSNLDNARAAVARASAPLTWNHMDTTAEDHNLKDAMPALARFDPPVIVATLREIARTIEHRSGLPFRQLAWRLPELSPLFDEETIRAVRAAYDKLIARPDILSGEDQGWVASMLVAALTPHLDAEAQLKLLLSLPPTVREYLHLRRALKALPAEVLERYLETALAHPDIPDLRRILFFASAAPAALTDRARRIIAKHMSSPDEITATCAAGAAHMARDPALNVLVLEQAGCQSGHSSSRTEGATWRVQAIAAAVVDQNRSDLLHLVAPPFLWSVATALGGETLDAAAEALGRALDRLLRPVATTGLRSVGLVVGVARDGTKTAKWVSDAGTLGGDVDVRTRFRELSDLEGAARRHAERQQAMAAEVEAFEAALAGEGAAELASAPPLDAIAKLVERAPDRVSRWLDRILAATEGQIRRQAHNLGIALAGAFAGHDAVKAAEVFQHLRDHSPPVSIVIGEERVPLYGYSLFRVATSTGLERLRDRLFGDALDDAALEAAVAAAEAQGAVGWLDGYVGRMVGSAHPGEQARGLAVAGLRHANGASKCFLGRSWGSGFLGAVAAASAKNYRRAQWAQHWLECALTASDPVDFWRHGRLAEGLADRRLVGRFGSLTGACSARFGLELRTQLERAAERRTRKRKDTLFGLKAPGRDLSAILRDDRAL